MMHSPYALERFALERVRERHADAEQALLRRGPVLRAERSLLAALVRRLEGLRTIARAWGTLTGAA